MVGAVRLRVVPRGPRCVDELLKGRVTYTTIHGNPTPLVTAQVRVEVIQPQDDAIVVLHVGKTLFHEEGVYDPVLSRSGNDFGWAKLGFNDGALGEDAPSFIVSIGRVVRDLDNLGFGRLSGRWVRDVGEFCFSKRKFRPPASPSLEDRHCRANDRFGRKTVPLIGPASSQRDSSSARGLPFREVLNGSDQDAYTAAWPSLEYD